VSKGRTRFWDERGSGAVGAQRYQRPPGVVPGWERPSLAPSTWASRVVARAQELCPIPLPHDDSNAVPNAARAKAFTQALAETPLEEPA
jgi:hypothetical protein